MYGTDGPGPTPGSQRALCNLTDGLNFAVRDKDRRRLRTALFMTEFGTRRDPNCHHLPGACWIDCKSGWTRQPSVAGSMSVLVLAVHPRLVLQH